MRQVVVFVLASSALAAAVATAHVVAPLPEGTSFRSVAIAKAEAAPAPVAASVAVQPRAAVETRQAPVPLLTREQRPTWAAPATLEASATTPTTPAGTAQPNEEGNRFAKGAIEADGYKGVRDITPGPDGSFRARAMRGRTEVTITVDREGRVSAN